MWNPPKEEGEGEEQNHYDKEAPGSSSRSLPKKNSIKRKQQFNSAHVDLVVFLFENRKLRLLIAQLCTPLYTK